MLHQADCVVQLVGASMWPLQPTHPCRQSCAAGEALLCMSLTAAGCSLSAVTGVSLLVIAAASACVMPWVADLSVTGAEHTDCAESPHSDGIGGLPHAAGFRQ